jgi:hypothetical protein
VRREEASAGSAAAWEAVSLVRFAGSSVAVRLGHVMVWLLVALFGLVMFGVFLGLAVEGHMSAVIGLVLLGVPALALPVWFAIGDTRRLRKGLLILTRQGNLEVDYPALFRSPLTIRPDQIRKAIVDDGRRWGENSETFRFPVYDLHADGTGTRELVNALWRPSDRRGRGSSSSLTPVVDASPTRIPNLALIFEAPVPVPELREAKDHTPMKGEALAGLLFHVEDPAEARAMLSQLTELGDADMDDAEHLDRNLGFRFPAGGGEDQAEPDDHARLPLLRRRAIRQAWGGLAFGVIVPVFALWPVAIGVGLLRGDRDRTLGAFFAVAGATVFAVRLFLWLHS